MFHPKCVIYSLKDIAFTNYNSLIIVELLKLKKKNDYKSGHLNKVANGLIMVKKFILAVNITDMIKPTHHYNFSSVKQNVLSNDAYFKAHYGFIFN